MSRPPSSSDSRVAGFGSIDADADVLIRGLGLVWLAIGLVYAVCGLTLDAFDFGAVAIVCLLAIGAAHSLRGRGWTRSATALDAGTLYVAICLSFTLLSVGVASFGLPLADDVLARADRLLFPMVDWPRLIPAIAARDGLPMRCANLAYGALTWEPLLLIGLLCAMGEPARCWRFLREWTVTLGLAVWVFALLPALGPYPHYAIGAAEVPAVHFKLGWHAPEVLAQLRAGSLRDIGSASLDGLIAFPSFHAAGGVLLIRAAWFHRRLRAASGLLNGAMILGAIPVGGHYFIDIAAGIGAAALGAHLATGGLVRRVRGWNLAARITQRLARA